MDIGTLFTLLFFGALSGTTWYCYDAPDKSVMQTMALLWMIWFLSVFAVHALPYYPVVTVALGDMAAAAYLIKLTELKKWQTVVFFLFIGMIICHASYLANLALYNIQPNFDLYLNFLAILSYSQILVVGWSKWQNGKSDTRLGKLGVVDRIAIWALSPHTGFFKTH